MGHWPIRKAVRAVEPCYWLALQGALPESRLLQRCPRTGKAAAVCRPLWEPRTGRGAAMAGSPGSGASLEGISLGSSEEAELQREGRAERRGGEAGASRVP